MQKDGGKPSIRERLDEASNKSREGRDLEDERDPEQDREIENKRDLEHNRGHG